MFGGNDGKCSTLRTYNSDGTAPQLMISITYVRIFYVESPVEEWSEELVAKVSVRLSQAVVTDREDHTQECE